MSTHLNAIPSDKIAGIVRAFRATGRVPAFMGPPGIGKTDQVRAAAAAVAADTGKPCPVVELHLAQLSEVDVRGYLIPDGKAAVFTAPVFWPMVSAHEQGILFLDEFMQAGVEVQKAVTPLLRDLAIGEYKLPEGWSIVLAGNGQDDLAGAGAVLSHIINSISLFEVKPPHPDDWVDWAIDNDVDPLLIAFAKSSPSEVFAAPIPTTGDTPFCTPRTVKFLSDIAKHWPGGLGSMANDAIGTAVIAATVGSGATAILLSLVKLAHLLPDYDAVIAAPDTTPVPDKLSHAYATVLMLCARARLEDAAPLVKYMTRFNPNHAIVGLRTLFKRDMRYTVAPEVVRWISANSELLRTYAKYLKPVA